MLLVLEPSTTQVLAKTDTHRQAELVRLLLSSAVLGGDGIGTGLTGGRL